MKRKIITVLLGITLVFLPTFAYANNEVTENLDNDYIISTQQFLAEKGFTDAEIAALEDDIFQVANLIEIENMNEEEISILKNGFLNSSALLINSEQNSYDVKEDGIVTFEDGNQTIAPHRNFNSNDANTVLRTPVGSTGPHAITYTLSNYKFYEATGYVEFPTVSISGSGSGGTGNGQIDSRPYMMFGAYQQTSPYKGCDAGLAYYKEYGGWVLFVNTGGTNGWHQNNSNGKPIHVITKNKVYLDMKLVNGGVTLIVRDPSTWTIIDQLVIPINSGFNDTPSNIELTREVALAQFERRDNGDRLSNAHWSQVYVYSKANSLTVPTTAQYLQSSHPDRYS